MKKSVTWFVTKTITVIKGKDFRVFLGFIVVSSLIWFFGKLREEYTVEANYSIHLTNVPEDYIIDQASIEPIRAVLTGNGLDLMMLPNAKKRTIEIDASELKRDVKNGQTLAIAIPKKHTNKIASTLPDYITIERTENDTIYIPLLTKVRKSLPVIVKDNIQLESQYMYSAPREVIPDSVWVSGTNDKLDTMKAVYTEELAQSVIHDTISLNLNLKLPNGVEANALGVQVNYFVEPYSEKSIQVPITAINIPNGYTFKAFPQFVNVTMSIGLSEFEKISANDIDIVADLSDIKPGDKLQKIKVRLTNYPENVKSISYAPFFVEYLLEHRHERNY